ncbi:MAG: DUF4064 domain-containing protein [Clostridium sp.]|uniref:DUF4064 domain-containing protein n=1 Tax=Clostridium sp. TaxID=1506 RepID=UPI003EE6D5D0
MKRTTEFVLALLGGIFGIFGAFGALMIGGIGQAFQASGSESVTVTGWIALIVSIVAIVFSVILKTPSKTKLSGIILIICAVVGFICIFMFYILPAVLILIAGIMCLIKKNSN